MLSTLSALAEPSRLRIVELLRVRPYPVGELSEVLCVRQPQVSKHLNTLRKAGLVTVSPDAQKRVYELCWEPLQELDSWLEGYRRLWAERFDELDIIVAEIQSKKGKK
jgi:DNA-binding transcriptional ArsR family regulator